VNDKDNEGSTPMHNAAYKGNVDCIQLLLDAGADPNIPDNFGIRYVQQPTSMTSSLCF
jgi:ankyrin repeat protein